MLWGKECACFSHPFLPASFQPHSLSAIPESLMISDKLGSINLLNLIKIMVRLSINSNVHTLLFNIYLIAFLCYFRNFNITDYVQEQFSFPAAKLLFSPYHIKIYNLILPFIVYKPGI